MITNRDSYYVFNVDLAVGAAWGPHPSLFGANRTAMIDAVNAVPVEWRTAPEEGEVFDRHEQVYARLRGYSLYAGFLCSDEYWVKQRS